MNYGMIFVESKKGEKVKLFYMDTDSFTVYTETEERDVDTAKDVEKRTDNSNHELERLLPREKNNLKKLLN